MIFIAKSNFMQIKQKSCIVLIFTASSNICHQFYHEVHVSSRFFITLVMTYLFSDVLAIHATKVRRSVRTSKIRAAILLK